MGTYTDYFEGNAALSHQHQMDTNHEYRTWYNNRALAERQAAPAIATQVKERQARCNQFGFPRSPYSDD